MPISDDIVLVERVCAALVARSRVKHANPMAIPIRTLASLDLAAVDGSQALTSAGGFAFGATLPNSKVVALRLQGFEQPGLREVPITLQRGTRDSHRFGGTRLTYVVAKR
jgi:hypothetical protein